MEGEHISMGGSSGYFGLVLPMWHVDTTVITCQGGGEYHPPYESNQQSTPEERRDYRVVIIAYI